MTHMRRMLLALLAGIAVLFGSVTAAHAEDGYRFWGYYTWTGQEWTFAVVGAHENIPEDGSVEGWRYAVSGNTPRFPRVALDFDGICAGVPAEDGKKRVAVVIDYGTEDDSVEGAPPTATGTCVVADPDTHGLDLLREVTNVRDEANMVCGVNGFPQTGCGDAVSDISVPTDEEPIDVEITEPVGSSEWDPTTAPSPETTAAPAEPEAVESDGNWQTWALGGGILLVIVVTGFFLSRRRQRES